MIDSFLAMSRFDMIVLAILSIVISIFMYKIVILYIKHHSEKNHG